MIHPGGPMLEDVAPARPEESRLRAAWWLAPFIILAGALHLVPRADAEAVQAAAPSLAAFERPGETFPGSAYFFAQDAFASSTSSGRANDAQLPAAYRGNRHILAIDVGSAAAPYSFTGRTGLDKARALACMTNAIYYEAGNEPEEGQRAVAQVVLNRLRHPEWPDSVCGVIYQGGERADLLCQFSFSCDGSMARLPHPEKWAQARRVAERALAGEVFAPAGLSTYYHTLAVRPGWASRLTPTAIIGAHIFYRMPGAGSTVLAFSDRYVGVETAKPGPYAFAAPSKLPPGDPALLGPGPALPPLLAAGPAMAAPLMDDATAAIRPAADMTASRLPGPLQPAARAASPASPTAHPAMDRLPQSSVKAEFANSGRALR